MLCARASLSPRVDGAIILVHGVRGSKCVARVFLNETFRVDVRSDLVLARVLIPTKKGAVRTLIDYGTAILHLTGQAETVCAPVIYHSTNEIALIQSQEARVTLHVDQCSLNMTARPSGNLMDADLVPDIGDYLALMSNWWVRTDLPLLDRIRGDDGDHAVPDSNVRPWAVGTFDLHAPNYGVASSHLPGWAFALPQCDDFDPRWLEHLVQLAGRRLGSSKIQMNALGNEYMSKKNEDVPFLPSGVVEILFDACALPAAYMPYSSDISTGRSQEPVERYSLTPRYGAAGDCEDGAKFIQTVFENFASLPFDAPVSAITQACADLSRRYVGGLAVVGARAGSFGAHSRSVRNSTDPQKVKNMGYNDFVSHMAFVAIPKYQVTRRGKIANVRGTPDSRAPERMWEAALLPIVLEGTGMKSSRADMEAYGGPLLSAQNGMKQLLKAPFHALNDSSNGFYIILNSFSFLRGAEYVDKNKRTCSINEMFFANQREGGELKYGALYSDLISGGSEWLVGSTLYKTGVTADYVRQKQEAVRQILDARGILPLCSLSVPDTREMTSLAEKILRNACQEKNVHYEDMFALNKDDVKGLQGFVNATSLTENTALEIVSSALHLMKKIYWNIDAVSPWHWGIRFVAL